MSDAFNYAIAEWGLVRAAPQDMFQRITLESNIGRGDANYHQCISIALWVTGKVPEALEQLKRALSVITEQPRTYLVVGDI